MKKTCSQCGGTGKIHEHHDDYAKPDETRPLCMLCHRRWHRDNGPGANAHLRPAPKRARDVQLLFRVNSEEDGAFRQAAAASGMDLTAWMRTMCRRGAGLPSV